MDPSAIPLILKELNLNENDVANIYHHGSWVYGSNTRESDRDLIFVTRSSVQRPIKFHEDFDYFHEFELHKLWNQYDICIYSVKNFEILLKKNYLCVLQCVFLPAEFKIKEEIDFRTIYLEKYYNPLRIKQVAAYEMSRDLNLYYSRNDRQHLNNHPTCSSKQLQTSQLRENYIFKNLFHGIRFLDFAEQLLQTKSISDFKRATYVLKEMKRIRRNLSRSSDLYPVVEYIRKKSFEYKSRFEALAPGNIMKGIFEVRITFPHTQDTLDRLNKVCENTRYQLLFNGWTTLQERGKSQELEVSSSYEGECPAIIEQIESEARDHFKDFNIVRIKIKSSISNEGVPHNAFEKQLLWNDKTNYFQLTYVFSLNNNFKTTIKSLRQTSRSLFDNQSEVQLHHTAFKHTFIRDDQFILTIYLFDVGRANALAKNAEILKYFNRKRFAPSEVHNEFIFYDTNIRLEED